MPFDLLLKGGEVIDPGSGRRGSFDVAVNRNRIAAVDRNIPASAAARVMDAAGKIVTPGLVDLHSHVFHGCSYWGVRPDPVASRSGVTTWVDAGSAGAMTLDGFREYIVKPARARIYAFLKKGDILTHCFTGFDMRIVAVNGKLRDSARDAWERGVVMDIGHGTGAFVFEVAEPLIQQDYKPTVISTDIHQLSIRGPMYDLPTCMNKCLTLGMSIDEVVEAATSAPARAVGLDDEVGSLKPGLMADIALFEVEKGTFRYYDVNMDMR